MIKLAIVHNIFLFTSCPAESHPLPCISLNFWWGLGTQIIMAHPVGATTVSRGVSTFLELPCFTLFQDMNRKPWEGPGICQTPKKSRLASL